MIAPKTHKGEIVQKFLSKYKGYGLKTIARALCKKHPEHFHSVEHARGVVRYHMGSSGKRNRKHAHIEKSLHDGEKHRQNPFGIPTGDTRDYTPFRIPKEARKITNLSDVHVPYHSKSAIEAVIKRGKEYQPDTVLINGDFLDCHDKSRFNKDPGAKNFVQELEVGRQILDILSNEIAPVRFIYKQGNHEERYDHYMGARAPELLDMDHFSFPEVFAFDILGIEWVAEKRIIMAGKLPIMHGHEFKESTFSPVNPARGYYMRSKHSVMGAHNHQTSEHTEPDLMGSVMTAWSQGCLCDLHPRYMPINRWNHGFAEINLSASGDYEVDNYRIDNGRLL